MYCICLKQHSKSSNFFFINSVVDYETVHEHNEFVQMAKTN